VVSNPATRVVDECVDPATRRVLLKYNDGVVEVTRLRASSFRLPRLIGRTRAEVYAMGGRPIQSLSIRALSRAAGNRALKTRRARHGELYCRSCVTCSAG
jgi:hypothetical protein